MTNSHTNPTDPVAANRRVVVPVVHEDAWLMVVNKPAGMVTQPGKGHQRDALLNGLFALHGPLLENLGRRRDFGLLHRLDKDTSGLLLVAKMPRSYDVLRRAFEARRIEKEYLAVVAGCPAVAEGSIDAPIQEVEVSARSIAAAGTPRPMTTAGKAKANKALRARWGADRYKKAVISRRGRPAVTLYRVLGQRGELSFVHLRLLTGRLHQVRLHMATLGCPVVGDAVYGPAGRSGGGRLGRLALHAWRLVFDHPCEPDRHVSIAAPPDGDLARMIHEMGWRIPGGDQGG
ncbi:MAG: RluA family pseudouridine synthase [Phycisphaeraceae bacterium]|nr:RluA family pseudouridine synthase [Phycisphaeraceae bacterium]